MSTKSPFLDLPAELRNRIYEYAVTHDDPLEIKTAKAVSHNQHLKKNSSLAAVSKQVNAEYYSVLNKTSLAAGSSIWVLILDFDFRPVIHFVRDEFVHSQTDGSPNLSISLVVTDFRLSKQRYLDKWLKFCATDKVFTTYDCREVATDVPEDMCTVIRKRPAALKVSDPWEAEAIAVAVAEQLSVMKDEFFELLY